MLVLLEHALHLVLADGVFFHAQVELEPHDVVEVGELEDLGLEDDVVEATLLARALSGQVVLAAPFPVGLVLEFVGYEVSAFPLRNDLFARGLRGGRGRLVLGCKQGKAETVLGVMETGG